MYQDTISNIQLRRLNFDFFPPPIHTSTCHISTTNRNDLVVKDDHNNNLEKTNNQSSKAKCYLEEINFFRGFAIFCIVWGHLGILFSQHSGANFSTGWGVLSSIQGVLVVGNSSIFVFISGFLFFFVFYKRGFDYQKFFKGKILKVFIPWLLITTLFLAYRVSRDHGSLWDSNFVYYGNYFYWSFWYVPFIMVAFLLSPLHVKFIELKTKTQILIIITNIILSMGLGRHNANPILSFLFWNTFYLVGIFTAIHYQRFLASDTLIKQCLCCICFLFIGFLISNPQYVYFSDYRPYDVQWFRKIELLVIGKILLALVGTYFFIWFKDNAWRWCKKVLSVLATYSFSIFFLHQFIILRLERHLNHTFSSYNFWEINGVIFLTTVASCVICIIIAYLIKKLTGKYSRMIIGA